MADARSTASGGTEQSIGVASQQRNGGDDANLIDPTKNVLDLVQAAVERLNDLRNADGRRIEQLAYAETRRVDDLRALLIQNFKDVQAMQAAHSAESRAVIAASIEAGIVHTRITENLRADYQEKLAIAEAKRIDAIRSVDVNAVAVASERATQQAQVLANQVAQSADALRTLVATTATTFAQQQQSLQTQITERLALLERSQYESKGKAGVEDPRLQDLLVEVKGLSASQNTSGGQKQGADRSWQILLGAIALIAFAMPYLSRKDAGALSPSATQAPIIYVQPAPVAPAPVVIQPGK